jgi:hypothetical protein
MRRKVLVTDETGWENGFEGHSDAQLLRLSRLSFEEKLNWLDAAGRFLRRLSDAKRNGARNRN